MEKISEIIVIFFFIVGFLTVAGIVTDYLVNKFSK
jgi:hypothetical protein